MEDLRRRVQEVPLSAAHEGRDEVVGAGVAARLPLRKQKMTALSRMKSVERPE